jgi:hypothetical protein
VHTHTAAVQDRGHIHSTIYQGAILSVDPSCCTASLLAGVFAYAYFLKNPESRFLSRNSGAHFQLFRTAQAAQLRCDLATFTAMTPSTMSSREREHPEHVPRSCVAHSLCMSSLVAVLWFFTAVPISKCWKQNPHRPANWEGALERCILFARL